MRSAHLLSLGALLCAVNLPAQTRLIGAWVQTRAASAELPALFSNKDWNGGKVIDTTSNHALGKVRDTGTRAGFAFFLQASGAWGFNLGDGKRRLDYLPGAPRQRVNDGKLHLLVAAIHRTNKECHLFFDGQRVAIYCIRGLGELVPAEPESVELAGVDPLPPSRSENPDPRAQVAGLWAGRGGSRPPSRHADQAVEQLKILAWNIWHGGRRDGNETGLRKTVAAIQQTGADIICMQETYGSGARIADALGFEFYLRSTNLSVMSRYPIVRTFDLYQPFRLGGVEIEVTKGQRLRAFSLWIHHLPSIGKQMAAAGTTPASLVAADDKTRGKEIRGILSALAPLIAEADAVPLVVAGDYNSPSHLDWTAATARRHQGMRVAWPVSSQMQERGFVDAFRKVHPDPAKVVGRTWSPRFVDSYQMRIDYVYYQGKALEATAAEMLDQHPEGWPSDHAAVLSTFRWRTQDR